MISAVVGIGLSIGPLVLVGAGSCVGPRALVSAGLSVGVGAVVGPGSSIRLCTLVPVGFSVGCGTVVGAGPSVDFGALVGTGLSTGSVMLIRVGWSTGLSVSPGALQDAKPSTHNSIATNPLPRLLFRGARCISHFAVLHEVVHALPLHEVTRPVGQTEDRALTDAACGAARRLCGRHGVSHPEESCGRRGGITAGSARSRAGRLFSLCPGTPRWRWTEAWAGGCRGTRPLCSGG